MKTYSRLTLSFLLLILMVPQVGADEPPEGGKEVTVWSDSSGKFKIEATFVELVDDKLVVLKRASDGKIIKVPFDKLSEQSKLEVAIAVIDTPDTKAQPKQDNDQVVDPVDKKIVQKKHQPAIKKAVGKSAIRKVLGKHITINVTNATLRQILDAMEEEARVEIYLDNRSVAEVADLKALITATNENGRFEAVLSNVLDDFENDLSWDVFNDVIRVTTEETAAENLSVVVYRVNRPVLNKQGRVNSSALIDQIQSIIEPATWDQLGGEGVACHYGRVIVVAQTRNVHNQLVNHYRANLTPVSSPTVRPNIQGNLKAIRTFISSRARVDLVAENDMLHEVIKAISKKAKIKIDVDWDLLQEEIGVHRQSRVSLDIRGVSPMSALGLVLNQIDPELTWSIKNDKVLITSRQAAHENMFILTYEFARPVDDQFIELIKKTIHRDSWDELGGEGVISIDSKNNLVRISQTLATHLRINKLIADLKAASR